MIPQECVANVLEFLDAIDLRAAAVASREMYDVLKHGKVWEILFRHYWNQSNFYMDPTMRIELSPALEMAYPRASDAFRFLTHCVQMVPSFADICLTNAHATTTSETKQIIKPIAYDNGQVVTISLAKEAIGGNRCVRANVPFEESPRVSVVNTGKGSWLVDVLFDGYFEISISEAAHPVGSHTDMCVAVGVASADFEVVDQQPGWDDNSYGYHGDDGHFFTGGQPQSFAQPYGAHDTIGCGILRDLKTGDSSIYFTKNGVRLGTPFPCCHSELYPVVGIDADYAVKLNCGRTPFQYHPEPSNAASNAALAKLQSQPWPVFKKQPQSLIDLFAQHVHAFLRSFAAF